MNADCCGHAAKSDLLGIEETLDRLLTRHWSPPPSELLPLEAALGRILADPVVSPMDVPPWDNSAMDGYAIRHQEVPQAGTRLPLSQRITAGRPAWPLEPGTAARIFTGAPVPEGADAVVVQEVCSRDGDWVEVGATLTPGANIRRAGEDIRRGQEILAAGIRLQPQHLGLAASVGVDRVQVYSRPRVALLCSGDELVLPGQPLGPGQIYNSNRFVLGGLLQGLGCEVRHLGVIEDSLEATCQALAAAAGTADLILATGGVSVGEEDHVKAAVERLGTLELWKVAIRPGKPLAFGSIQGIPFFGFPGNPVSAIVTFWLFARPFILRLQGRSGDIAPLSLQARADFAWPKPDKRPEYVRARRRRNDAGELVVQVHPSRSSGVLSSVAWADGLVVIPGSRVIQPGDRLEFLPFEGLLG